MTLPEGFVLDTTQNDAGGLPEGFTLDEKPHVPPDKATTVEEDIPIPDWAKDHPNLFGAYGAGKAVLEQAVTPAVEGTVTVLGGIFGSPIVGSSLGYVAADRGMDIVEEAYGKLGGEKGKKRTITGAIKGTAEDVLVTMALGKGTQVGLGTIGKIFKAAKPQLKRATTYLFDKLPQRLYSSAVKMPTSSKWTKILPRKEITKREFAAIEGIRSKIRPTEYGRAKIDMLEKEVRSQIDDATAILSEDPNIKIKVDDVLEHGLKKAYGRAKVSSDPEGSKAVVDKVREAFKEHGEFLTPANANAIKRALYKEVHWGEAVDPMTAVSKKGIARDIMFKLEELYPDLQLLNETDAARMGLSEAIEKSIAKAGNRDIVSLGTKILATHPKAWPLAAWNATLGHPQIKANVAFALSKANPAKYSRLVYPELPPGYSPAVEIAETGVYRYTPESQFFKSKIPKKPKVTLRPGEKPIKVKNKAQEARELEQYRKGKQLDEAFRKQKSEQGRVGPPLKTPSREYVKSKTPPELKTIHRTAEKPPKIPNKQQEMLKKEEAKRLKHLEELFKEQQRQKSLKGPPLRMPRKEMTKSVQPPSVEKRLKGLK